MSFRGVLATGLCLLWFVACGSTSGGGGTQTNWVECRTNDECRGGQICVERICRDPLPSDAGDDSVASDDASGDTGSIPPPSSNECELPEPETFEPGDGRCTPPSTFVPDYCLNACSSVA